MNYIDILNNVISKNKKENALVFNERVVNYAELSELAGKIAGKIHTLKIKKQSFILIHLPRGIEYVASYLGILKAGCVFVPTTMSYPEDRINFIKDDCNAALVIEEDFFKDIDIYDEYEDLAKDEENATLIYTSGSTGNPKGILHSVDSLEKSLVNKDVFNVNKINFAAIAPNSFAVFILEYFSILALGGCVHILSEEDRVDINKIEDYYEKNNINVGFISPQLLKLYKGKAKTVKNIFTGSERLSDAYFKDVRITNIYGMSEVFISSIFVVDKKYENTPIGKQINDTKMSLAKEDNEILIDVPHKVTYFKNEDDPRLVYKNGRTLVHSGDIGHLDENGNFVYDNRKDWMVKINGQRVETKEIEEVVKKLKDIDCVVKGFVDSSTYLVLYYVSNKISEDDIKKVITKKLPHYMMPRFFVKMDKFPVNANGKLDFKSLKSPEVSSLTKEYVAPSSNEEKALCKAFEEVLGVKKVGLNDDFFALGGDSIKVLEIVDKANIEGLEVATILSKKTPGEIAKGLSKSDKKIKHYEKLEKEYPLTDSQKGIYLACLQSENKLIYNCPFILSLPDKADGKKVIKALKDCLSNHPGLFVSFKNKDGKLVMVPNKVEPVVEEKSVDDLEKEKKDFIKEFDLENGVLYHIEYVTCNKKKYVLFDFHHISFDGTSLNNFVNEICSLYRGEKVEPEQLNVFDEAIYEQENIEHGTYKDSMKFYEDKLSSIDVDSVIASDQIDDNKYEGATLLEQKLDLDVKAIEKYTKDNGLSENSLFLGAFAYTLAKFNGTNEALFASVNNGRHDPRLSKSMGMFVRTMPLYFNIDEEGNIKDYLANTQSYFFEAMSHDDASFSELANKYHVSDDISFVYQASLFNGGEMEGSKVLPVELEKNSTQASLDIMMIKHEEGYSVSAHFENEKYTSKIIACFIEMYCQIIKEFITKDVFKNISLLDNKQEKWYEDINNKETADIDCSKTIVELFNENVKKYPSKNAIVYKDRTLTYKELDEYASNLAKELVSKGLGKEDVVGVLINKSEFMAICALGVLKSGAAYLPIDPSYPIERINLMLSDSKAKMLICDEELSTLPSEYKGPTILTKDIKSFKDKKDIKLTLPHGEDLFIMLYTSGTTGTPKGVMLEHHNLSQIAQFSAKRLEYNQDTKTTAYASFGFDASMFDLYPTLIGGGTIYIIPEDRRMDLNWIQSYVNENEINHMFMTTQLGRQFALMEGTKTLKYLSVGGEKLVPLDPPSYHMFNLYGPTECSIYSTYYEVDKKYKDIPIGQGLDNMKLYVVDKYGRILPPYATGELIITGPQVSRGYLNRPEKTKEAYSDGIYCKDKKYAHEYHSGDVVRFMEDGNVQFIGRKDSQVKIRGFRIELTEVEEVIRRYKGIDDATVAAYENPNGGKYIVAYVTSKNKVDVKDLNAFIGKEKPSYMIPQFTMQLDKIPYTTNQKVNKRALPKPDESKSSDSNNQQAKVGKLTKCEEQIAALVLKATGVSINDVGLDLRQGGLTSLAAISLSSDIQKQFNVEISVKDLLNGMSIVEIEDAIFNYLLNHQGSGESTKVEEVIEELNLDAYPLTETQFGVYSECLMNPDTTMYNVPSYVRISNKVGVDKLKDTLTKVINAHYSLKSTIEPKDNDSIMMIPHKDAEVKITQVKGTKEEFEDYKDKFVKPFDLKKELYRIALFVTKDSIYMLFDFHHIIFDGTSLSVLLTDIDKALKGEEIAPEKYSIYNLAVEENKLMNSPKLKEAEDYYDSLLKGCEGCSVPDSPLGVEKKGSNKEYTTILSTKEIDPSKVKKFVDSIGVSENVFFLSIMSIVLNKYVNGEEVTFTTVYNGRSSEKMYHLTGMLVKTLPLRNGIDYDDKLADFMKNMQKQLLDNMSNDIYSFAKISRKYKINQDVMFIYQGNGFISQTLGGYEVESNLLTLGVAKRPLTVNLEVKDGGYEYTFEYDESYTKEWINDFFDIFNEAVKSALSAEKIKNVKVLSTKAKNLIEKFNKTDLDIPYSSVNKLFEKQAKEHPSKDAVVCCNGTLTYGELNSLANRLAHSLIETKLIKKDTIVGMLLDRTKEVFITEQGIMKAGGAFLPLVHDYPFQRIDYCLKDANAPIVVTTKAIYDERKDLGGKNPYKVLFVEDLIKNKDDSNPDLKIDLDALAYCIYTSGSTGNPKGVMIEHRNMFNYVYASDKHPSMMHLVDNVKAGVSVTSISFDMSLNERWVSMCNGTTLVFATNDQIHNPKDLAALMKENKCETMVCTPSYLMSLLDIPEMIPCIKNVKAYHIGGEAFPMTLVNKLREIRADSFAMNGYGPTETTVACSSINVQKDTKVTIGWPEANVKLYVFDKGGNMLPPGLMGELIIAGAGVGRGYINLPEKNAASFFNIDGLKAYHSGDLVRLNNDGQYEYFGRMDNQVKLRGLRVELDEIENVMLEYPGMNLVKVIVRNNGTEDYLAGFFTAKEKVDVAKLTEHLKSKLTYYMVPSVLMQLDNMPLTVNGKIDKKQLPEVEYIASSKAYEAPSSELEVKICDIYKDVLKLNDKVSVSESFFEIGGTSLSATKVVMHLQNDGYSVVYKDVFNNPSARELAEYISGDKVVTKTSTDITNYDYTKINELLSVESLINVDDIKPMKEEDVILTGATGFLGIHVLHEFIKNTKVKVYCLIRQGKAESLEKRLTSLWVYYFGEAFTELKDRVELVEGDITDTKSLQKLLKLKANIVINCAACVKHFVEDDILDRINVQGVKNLIQVCLEGKKKLVQISTGSVAGEGDEKLNNVLLHESELYLGQMVDNDYVRTKFLAERAILEAKANKGLDGLIIRVGNLMSRASDGEFQINFITNGFMRMLKSYKKLEAFPMGAMNMAAEFSPVDCTASAIRTLAFSKSKNSVYHAFNNHVINMADVIYMMKEYGFKIDIVSNDEFSKILQKAKKDDSMSDVILGVSAYDSKEANPRHFIGNDNKFTTECLYRLSYKWPIISNEYLKNVIVALDTLRFFD